VVWVKLELFLLVFVVVVDLVVPWKMLIEASSPASNSPGSARVFMNVMWSFVMLAMSNNPSHISTTSLLSRDVGVVHDLVKLTAQHHLEVVLIEDVAVILGDAIAKTVYCLPRLPMKICVTRSRGTLTKPKCDNAFKSISPYGVPTIR
jgi:hypothetical protein